MPIRPVYLDNHATTPTDPQVVSAMDPWWREHFGNPHSGDHWFGWMANQAVESARNSVAELIQAGADEIIFTSGATEGNNLSIIGAGRARAEDRTHIVVSAIEHKCVLESAAQLKREGFSVDVAPIDHNGFVQLDVLDELITDRTALVSVMLVNNEIGTIQPIAHVSELCRAAGAWLHCDAAQAPAATRIDVDLLDVHFLSLSAHKIYGPKGIGALYAKADIQSLLKPLTFGGGQEHALRSGTVPTPLAVGFGKAAELMINGFDEERVALQRLRDILWSGIGHISPKASLNGSLEHRHPANLNVLFPGCGASSLIGSLQPHLAISTGSACSTGMPEPSYVLSALGLSLEQAEASVRFGLGRFTTESDIHRALALLESVLGRIEQDVA